MFLQLNSDDFPFFCFQDWTSVAKVSLFSTLIFFAQFFSLFSMIWRRLREASLKNMPQPFAPPPRTQTGTLGHFISEKVPQTMWARVWPPKSSKFFPKKLPQTCFELFSKRLRQQDRGTWVPGYLGTRVLGTGYLGTRVLGTGVLGYQGTWVPGNCKRFWRRKKHR